MSDSSAVDNALSDKLRADATLTALMPDGVYIDEAPPGMKRFVLVSLVTTRDETMFEGRAFEDNLYLVKAVALSTVTADIKAAAARIDALLDPQPPAPPATLTIAGYHLMVMKRVSRERRTEVDDTDSAIRWQHRGGQYQVMVAPTTT